MMEGPKLKGGSECSNSQQKAGKTCIVQGTNILFEVDKTELPLALNCKLQAASCKLQAVTVFARWESFLQPCSD